MQTQYKGPVTLREKYTGDTVGIVANKGFYVNATGTLNFKLRGETVTQPSFPVVAGVHYQFDIEDITFTSGTTTVTEVWVLFAASI